MSVSAAAYHHIGVADQVVKHRVNHREEQAPDLGGAQLAHSDPLSCHIAQCQAARGQDTAPHARRGI